MCHELFERVEPGLVHLVRQFERLPGQFERLGLLAQLALAFSGECQHDGAPGGVCPVELSLRFHAERQESHEAGLVHVAHAQLLVLQHGLVLQRLANWIDRLDSPGHHREDDVEVVDRRCGRPDPERGQVVVERAEVDAGVEDRGGRVVRADGVVVGAAGVRRAECAEGVEIVMLTGDARPTAEAVARELGIERFSAEVRPEEKLAEIERLQAEGRFVAMAGDGINDAPALARAQVGIAMGTGTDVAMESAAVTLVRGDLRAIVTARRLSHATLANIRQNLAWAFGYNTLGIPIAAGLLYPWTGWLLSPMLAAAAMSFSSVSVIANALRLRRKTL